MNAPVKHTIINVLSFTAGLMILYHIDNYILDPAHQSHSDMSDQTFGDAAGVVGAIFFVAALGFIFLCIWSLRVIWVIKNFWDIKVAAYINLIILIIPWSPFIFCIGQSAIHKTSNYFHRMAYTEDKICLKSIAFGHGLSLHSWTVHNDSVFIALTNIEQDAKTQTHDHVQYYYLRENKLIHTERTSVSHLLNHNDYPFRYRDYNGLSFFAKRNDSLETKLYITTEDECCTTVNYLRSFVFHKGPLTLIDSLEGFDDLEYHLYTPNFQETSAYSIDESGNITFPLMYGHIKNGGYEHHTIAEKKVGERIRLREIDFGCLPKDEGSAIKGGFFHNFISRNQYIYMITNSRIYYLND